MLGCKRNHLALLLSLQVFARMRDKASNPNEGKESGVSQKVSHPNFRANLFCRCEKCKRKGTHKPLSPPAFCVPSSTAPFGAAHFQKTKSVQLSSLYIIAILAKVIEVILGLKLIEETKGTKLG